ncbi:hypothetical protein [Streptomyces sp. NPDC047869]|uniref:hypothetical protein n=1 Tax=Streptomyces sp. NPDC047869 TaxID=3154709 RepID=UPI0034555054
MTSDLSRQVYKFAKELQATLNGTVCQHVRIAAVLRPRSVVGPVFTLGNGLSAANPTQPIAFPLRIDNKKPRAWMNLSYQVRLDDEDDFLTVHSSYCGIFTDEALETCLLHWDYEREKDRYTSAHVQVYGTSPALEALNRNNDQKRSLDKLHIPVGGKRFRPCVEDVIEFLITERLADGREGWEKRVEEGRNHYRRGQLLATMRRNPDVVKEYLESLDAEE